MCSGLNASWFDNYSTCGQCHSLQLCPLCEEGYEEGELIVQCINCSRLVNTIFYSFSYKRKRRVGGGSAITNQHSAFSKTNVKAGE